VPYVALPKAALKLHSKTDLLYAITIYRSGRPEALGPGLTPYQRRQQSESLARLERAGLLIESDDSDALLPLPLADTPKGRIIIPAQYDYTRMSLVAIKAVIACHGAARYERRTPFRITVRRTDLAQTAGIAERRLRDALRELEQHHFIQLEKKWRAGTQITLCEPNSDTPLFYLGDYYRMSRNAVPVCERYRFVLADLDPKGKLGATVGPVTGYKVYCPFCRFRGSPTFNFTSTDDGDEWRCYNCRRHGDSDRLWVRFANWRRDTDWRTIIRDGTAPNSNTDQHDAMNMLGQFEEMTTNGTLDTMP
jgi:hypothetical protein